MTFESLLHNRRAHGFAERRWFLSVCLIYRISQQHRKCVRKYSCVCVWACVRVSVCMCVRVRVNCVSYVLLDAYVYFKRAATFWCRWYLLLYVVAYMYICTYTHAHACTVTNARTRTHTHTYTHIHTHTYTCIYCFIPFAPHPCVATHQPGSRTDQAQTTMRQRWSTAAWLCHFASLSRMLLLPPRITLILGETKQSPKKYSLPCVILTSTATSIGMNTESKFVYLVVLVFELLLASCLLIFFLFLSKDKCRNWPGKQSRLWSELSRQNRATLELPSKLVLME